MGAFEPVYGFLVVRFPEGDHTEHVCRSGAFQLATQHPDAATVRPMQYGTALVLITLVLGVNLAAIVLRNRFSKRYRW